MEGGKILIQFPQYLFTAELVEDKLVMVRSHRQFQQDELLYVKLSYTLILKHLFSFSHHVELHNAGREGCDVQKNQQEDLILRDSTCFHGKEETTAKA